jgi:hypothetical protein
MDYPGKPLMRPDPMEEVDFFDSIVGILLKL